MRLVGRMGLLVGWFRGGRMEEGIIGRMEEWMRIWVNGCYVTHHGHPSPPDEYIL